MTCFVVALPAEAKPLITHYRLQASSHTETLPIYQSGDLHLIISGVGKSAAAEAVQQLQKITQNNGHHAWINIGIAGHKHFDLNQGYIADKITDADTSRNWYPPRLSSLDLPSHHIITVDAPELEYQTDCIYEMEASGFYEAASRHSTHEIIQSYKIISDNLKTPSVNINAKLAKQLVQDHLPKIDRIVCTLNEISLTLNNLYNTPPIYDQLIEQHHFTQTQQHQLKRLIRRSLSFGIDQQTLSDAVSALKNSRDIILALDDMLSKTPVTFINTDD